MELHLPNRTTKTSREQSTLLTIYAVAHVPLIVLPPSHLPERLPASHHIYIICAVRPRYRWCGQGGWWWAVAEGFAADPGHEHFYVLAVCLTTTTIRILRSAHELSA